MTVDVVVVDAEIADLDYWVKVIRADLNRTVEGIVSAGAHLIAAKASVNHGEWLPMLGEIGIAEATARQFMSIGGNAALTNRRNCDDLPTAARALYELSRAPAEAIEAGIRDGAITPEMTIPKARGFVLDVLSPAATAQPEPKPEPEPEPDIDQSRIDRTKGRGQMASSLEMLRSIEGTLAGVAMACRYIDMSEIDPVEVGETIRNINTHLSTIRNTTKGTGARK